MYSISSFLSVLLADGTISVLDNQLILYFNSKYKDHLQHLKVELVSLLKAKYNKDIKCGIYPNKRNQIMSNKKAGCRKQWEYDAYEKNVLVDIPVDDTKIAEDDNDIDIDIDIDNSAGDVKKKTLEWLIMSCID